jgi:putative ABC transport system permease protein
VAGILLGFALSLVLIFVVNKQSFGWTIQFHPPGALLGGAILLIWCVTVLAGLYPARVAARLNPIEVILEE